MIFRDIALLLLVVVLGGGFSSPLVAELQKFPTSELTIVSANGPHRFNVEVA